MPPSRPSSTSSGMRANLVASQPPGAAGFSTGVGSAAVSAPRVLTICRQPLTPAASAERLAFGSHRSFGCLPCFAPWRRGRLPSAPLLAPPSSPSAESRRRLVRSPLPSPRLGLRPPLRPALGESLLDSVRVLGSGGSWIPATRMRSRICSSNSLACGHTWGMSVAVRVIVDVAMPVTVVMGSGHGPWPWGVGVEVGIHAGMPTVVIGHLRGRRVPRLLTEAARCCTAQPR